jgi:hypothetical protein
MTTITVTAKPPLEMILLGKTAISLRGEIKIPIFYRNMFFRKLHRQKYHFNAAN